MSLIPQVIPTADSCFNKQPFGSNISIWGVGPTDTNWDNADSLIAGGIAIDLTGLSAYTLSNAQSLFGYIRFTGTPSGSITVTVPNQGRQYIFNNSTGQSIIIVPYAGTGATIAAGIVSLFRIDKTTSTAIGIIIGTQPVVSPAVIHSVAADYTITLSDAFARAIIEVDASGGLRTITYPLGLASGYVVTIVKTDSTANLVNISNGTSVFTSLAFPLQAEGIYSNLSTLRVC